MSRVVTFGEIMARLAPPGFQRFQQAMPGSVNVTFAGAEASIAASIAFMGGDAAFVTALPDHVIADACVANLRAMGVDTRHIVRTPDGRLGLYFYEAGANQRPAQVIYDRDGASVSIASANVYDWNAIFEGAEWFVISGITPAISHNAAEVTAHAIHEASARGVKVACDMNFRSKLWRWEPGLSARELATRTMRGLMPMVDMFIGGAEDAVQMLGIESRDDSSLTDVARQITQHFPRVSRVAMTVRQGISASHNTFRGVLYDAKSDTLFSAPNEGTYDIVNIVDRLGAGDAFTAGLIFALMDEDLREPSTAVAFATAAGCLAHSIEGDFNFSTRAEIEALMAGDASGRVRR